MLRWQRRKECRLEFLSKVPFMSACHLAIVRQAGLSWQDGLSSIRRDQ